MLPIDSCRELAMQKRGGRIMGYETVQLSVSLSVRNDGDSLPQEPIVNRMMPGL